MRVKDGTSTDVEMRVEALHALVGRPMPEVEKVVLEALDDPEGLVRIAALEIFCDSFHPDCRSLLTQALQDDAEEVRVYAANKLRDICRSSHYSFRISARPSVSVCLEQLSSRLAHVREAALKALVGVTDATILDPVLAVLKTDQSFWCRLSALEVVQLFETPEVTDELFSLLGDDRLGGNAARALAAKRNSIIEDRLLEALSSSDDAVRLAAAVGVKDGCDPRVLLPLLAMVVDDNLYPAGIAMNSISSLCKRLSVIPEKTSNQLVYALMKAAQADGEQPRVGALDLLVKLAPAQACPLLLQTIRWYGNRFRNGDETFYWHHVLNLIARLGTPALHEALRQVRGLGDGITRILTAEALVKLGDEHELEVLIALLAEDDWEVRARAALALLSLGRPEAMDELVMLLMEDVVDEWSTKKALLESLSANRPEDAFRLFVDILGHEDRYRLLDEDLGWIIAWLGNYGDQRALEQICRFMARDLSNCDPDVVFEAINKLSAEAICSIR